MKLLLVLLVLFSLCEPASAPTGHIYGTRPGELGYGRAPIPPQPPPLPPPPPPAGQDLVDPFRVQGGRFYDLRAMVTNYLAWSTAKRVPRYPPNSTMERERLRNLALFDPVTHGWGQFIVSGRVHEQRPDGLVLVTGERGSPNQRFFLLKNSPFTMSAGRVTALAIPISRGGDMAVYDYGVPASGPPAVARAPAKSTNAVPVAKP